MYSKIKQFKTRHQIAFAVIVGIGAVSFWRGAWGLMDVFLFPSNDALNFLVSLVAGVVILGSTHYIVKELM